MNKTKIWEVVRFCLVGLISFLIDYGLLFSCTEWLGIFYLYSSAISFTVSVIVNYWLRVIFVFKGTGKQNGKKAFLFIGSSIVGLGLNQVFMWLFVEKMGIYYMISKVIATIIVMIWNYVMKRKAIVA